MVADSTKRGFGQDLFTLVRTYRQHTDPLLEDFPAGPRGFYVMVAVEESGPRNQQALACSVGIDRTVMTYTLDALQQAGLTERLVDPDDRRARLITLTAKGRQALHRTRAELDQAESEFLSPLTATERQALTSLLQRAASATDE
ncbi:Transcriptional regulator, MarR family OS=Tsukamurella paurometabola (strain ATCC 8368 / DSM/ CCUG 35730 / CIP 100753 / JCM 10117 / KCTC 9821 / NBRC 16120/ NCIMB 702349 / NCTC 13040) OX=521096 GN=Tpau_0696 PE=4 SV=1 [Tsukamurella paurometabola]|uniref:Transcriptional regulator, MarR family n=1 Tax=Tsukamurella paurometabola (strain ATCC 8368 / DSM 20162 / CCUG 35730 / CIP 100753 / JCM 10117 / KCTC 9821 / NBRC 16120 / NCIMB 702349 / NCTC 13040) TaxID=521096 RepID=D5UT46_TSUPD|nr:MarR family transcriptional regulator [Tsukamurella paurometabola]ADG77333.1 transcriptional regulator, MarR family [Tsukamurella paurometabola DSM 20162]SUP43518.1 Salmolysin [Tsukamurella paurometabola]